MSVFMISLDPTQIFVIRPSGVGLAWGVTRTTPFPGYWDTAKDYQHFSRNGR